MIRANVCKKCKSCGYETSIGPCTKCGGKRYIPYISVSGIYGLICIGCKEKKMGAWICPSCNDLNYFTTSVSGMKTAIFWINIIWAFKWIFGIVGVLLLLFTFGLVSGSSDIKLFIIPGLGFLFVFISHIISNKFDE